MTWQNKGSPQELFAPTTSKIITESSRILTRGLRTGTDQLATNPGQGLVLNCCHSNCEPPDFSRRRRGTPLGSTGSLSVLRRSEAAHDGTDLEKSG